MNQVYYNDAPSYVRALSRHFYAYHLGTSAGRIRLLACLLVETLLLAYVMPQLPGLSSLGGLGTALATALLINLAGVLASVVLYFSTFALRSSSFLLLFFLLGSSLVLLNLKISGSITGGLLMEGWTGMGMALLIWGAANALFEKCYPWPQPKLRA